MEIGRGPIAGLGSAPAERSSGHRVACSHGRSLRVFYGHIFQCLCSGYCDAGKPLVCFRDLCGGSLLRNFVDPALVDSEDFRIGTRTNAVALSPQLAINRHFTHLSTTDGCTGCDPNRKQSKFERNGLISPIIVDSGM